MLLKMLVCDHMVTLEMSPSPADKIRCMAGCRQELAKTATYILRTKPIVKMKCSCVHKAGLLASGL